MGHQFDNIRKKGLEFLKSAFGERAVERAVDYTMRFQVEVPGWQFWEGFGGGARFESGGTGGAARSTEEIAADAGLVHRLTRSAPAVGQHILWFFSRDGINGDIELARQVAEQLEANDVSIGSVSPTFFLAGSEDGSFSSQDPAVRQRFIDQTVLGAQIAAELGSGLLTLWLSDGTNYPGQRDLQDKIELMKDCFHAFREQVSEDNIKRLDKVLVEYKVFEPGTYSTTIPDWGTARELSRIFGEKGGVLVDLGHHHHGTNIEQIVAFLIVAGVRGGLHFNTRYAADDDHSVQADYALARIFYELLQGEVILNREVKKNWSYAIDQMATAEKRIPSILKSLDALKRSIAKAALLNTEELRACQKARDIIGSNTEFEHALLHADTGPIVMESFFREGLHPVPLVAYHESGYQGKIEQHRAKPLI